MNYTPADIHRSLRRFFVIALDDDDWTARVAREEVRDSDRPVIVVEPASGIVTTTARRTIPQGDVDKQRAFSAMAYPVIMDSAREAAMEAARVAKVLDDAITHGIVDDDGLSIGGPLVLPVWDYDDVPIVGVDRAGGELPYGYVWVEDHSVNVLQDPIDFVRFTVPVDMRLSWRAGGRIVPDAPVVARMPGHFVPPAP